MQHINTGEYRATAKEIGQKHGSRKRRSPRKKWPSRASKNEQQLSLF
jgi:hypothetical protein